MREIAVEELGLQRAARHGDGFRGWSAPGGRAGDEPITVRLRLTDRERRAPVRHAASSEHRVGTLSEDAPAHDVPASDYVSALVASFLGWTLDAFDFFILVFVLPSVARDFGKTIPDLALTITVTLPSVRWARSSSACWPTATAAACPR
jgi:SHS family lactate transporter-like MFS transporter